MASRLTVLYYDGSKWVELKNREENAGFDSENATTPTNKPYFYSGGSPVLAMELEDLQGAPLEITLTLNNRQNKPLGTFTEPNNSYTFGEDPLVNPQVPQFHGLLAEFTRIIVYETSTFMTLFVGRILKREETYDLARGSTLTLTCRDALHELTRNSPFEYAQGQQKLTFRNYTTFEESGSPYTTLGALETRNHYHIIKKLVEQTSFANSSGNIEIGFSDPDKIESWTTAPRIKNWAEDSVRIDPHNVFSLNKVRNKNTLTEMQDQASGEVWALGANKMGFTFHLDATRFDPRLQASGATLLPQQDFVYARRGYKNTINPSTAGLSIKYAVNSIDETSTLTNTDKTRNMLQEGYEFEAHGNPFISHLILTYPHTKELNRDKEGGNNPKGKSEIYPKFANYFDWSDAGSSGRVNAQTPSTRYWDASDPDAVINGYTWDMYDVLGVDPDSDEEAEETLAFTLLYVQPYDSNDNELEDFSVNYADGDISQTWPNSAVSSGHLTKLAAGKYKSRSFHQVSSLHTKIGPLNNDISVPDQDETPANIQQVFTGVNDWPFYNYGTKTWIGNVQMQGKDEDGNHYIIISHPQEDVLRTLTAGDVLYERSHYYEMDHSGDGTSNPRGAKIKFVSYPAADRGTKQTLKIKSPKAPYQELRNRIENEFLKANNRQAKRLRTGTFRIKDYPHITRKGTAGLLSSGSALYPSESFDGNTTPANYGMKRGCAVQRTSGHADKYVGYIGTVNATNVVASLWKEDTLANASPVVGSWQSGDTYSIHIPLRAGDSIRVENLLLGINGDFLIESIFYSWSNGQVYAEIDTIGMNDMVVFKSRPSLDDDNLDVISELVDPVTIEKTALASGAYTARGVLWWHDNEHEETPSEVSNPLKKDYNTFSWSGGSLIVNSGRKKTYIFKAGDTDEALVRAGLTTFNDSSDPGAPSPPNTCMGPNTQYILYLDRNGTVDNLGRYSLNIDIVDHSDFGYSKADSYIELAYLHIGTLEDAGSKTIGKPGTSFYSRTIDFPKGIPNIQFLYVFDNTWGLSSNIMNPGFSFNKNSMTSALLKPGARPWASNISIRAHTNENYNQIMWDNGSPNGASTLTYGDATSISIAAGTKTTGLDDNRTYYMYIDTAASTTPQFTESHATATGDAQLLLALIVVGDDTNQTAPTILPFNSKVPTLNAVAIAANAITADHIQANTVTTIREGVTKANVGLGNVDNNSTSTIRGGVTPIHVSDNMTGVTMNSDGFIYSGSKSTYASDTAGWFIGFDDVASNTSRNAVFNFGTGSNRIRWTGSALQIIGDLTGSTGSFASGAVVIGAGGITFNDANAINGLAFHLHVRNNSTDSYSLGTYSYGTGREAGVLWMRGGGTASSQAPFIFLGGAGSDYASFRPGSNEWLGTSGQAWGKVFTDSLVLEEQSSSPGDVTNGHGQLYTKSDGNLYYKAGGVSEVNLGAGGGNDYSNVSLVDGLGTTSGVQNNSADQSGDTLGLKAGLGIKLHGSTAGTPEIEIELEGAKAATGQSYYMAYYSASNVIEKTSNMWINFTASPLQFTLVNADFYMNSQRIHALNRGNTSSNCDLNFNADSNTGIMGIADGNFALVTNAFKAIDLKKHPQRATVGISGNSDATYNLTVSGTAYKTGGGTHWNSTSDDRIKTDVSPLTSAVTKLSELKPISYKWSDNWQEATQAENYTMHGFLASEYKTVFPNHTGESSMTLYKVDDKWVSYLDGDIHPDRISERVENIVTINDSVLTPYLIAAIQELKAEIETLKGQIGG